MVTKNEVADYLRKNPGVLGDEFYIKRKVPSKKHTFEVEVELLSVFFEEAGKRGLKIKEAINQALIAWVGKK